MLRGHTAQILKGAAHLALPFRWHLMKGLRGSANASLLLRIHMLEEFVALQRSLAFLWRQAVERMHPIDITAAAVAAEDGSNPAHWPGAAHLPAVTESDFDAGSTIPADAADQGDTKASNAFAAASGIEAKDAGRSYAEAVPDARPHYHAVALQTPEMRRG